MRKSAAAWAFAGLLAGFAGLAAGFLAAELMNLRLDPVGAVAELVHGWLPSDVVSWARDVPGPSFTTPGILLLGAVVFVVLGRLARRSRWLPVVGYVVLAALGGLALLEANGASRWWLLPVVVGFVVMTLAMLLVGERLRRLQALPDQDVYGPAWRARRREVLLVAGVVTVAAGFAFVMARVAGRDLREVESERRTKVREVTAPDVPADARLDVDGAAAWMTPIGSFYLVDTAVVRPVLRAQDWTVRIHGMVTTEIELTFAQLVDRGLHEDWMTLACVQNEVGGDLVGNAWFSGVLLEPLLAAAGPLEGADAVLQTAEDGWTCGTPLAAMTDGRGAMLAVAMNGEPLTVEHGYPVRTVVPGLYGYVSATKWVVDLEVTRFEDITPSPTDQGFAELGPTKTASRIEVPQDGATVPSGQVVVAGTAWAPGTGIEDVEVQVDGGPWASATLGGVPNVDTWVQWKLAVEVEPGEHAVLVRATDRAGRQQTSVATEVKPDGATGWHTVAFTST
ncbi:molybdopterin-dependent oxidoreductase [Nocardioides dongxiaopingii]|uniref:molybdopterin-dependent oxidoreductase n=1 Tax=Nocardioides sp. S-1144 TaxID=2582905 RepID=UPI00110EA22F|nr:molybdopterin-dependent oxidoreductase [Nocardioides sp. S-1144]QCW51797.1 molybdopterin-dependent oxidoreductase [Nocardioides sp. S-1144]